MSVHRRSAQTDAGAQLVAHDLIVSSVMFKCEPMPSGWYEFTVKREAQSKLDEYVNRIPVRMR